MLFSTLVRKASSDAFRRFHRRQQIASSSITLSNGLLRRVKALLAMTRQRVRMHLLRK